MTAQNETPGTQASLEQRLADAVSSSSEQRVVERCLSLLSGGYEGEDFLRVVGGHHAEGILGGAPALYWPELWGTRALLHVWDDSATPAVVAALGNQAWRVREMAERVCAERGVGDTASLAPLLNDDHARVRAGAARALAAVGDDTTKPLLERLLQDPDREVRRAAQQSAKALAARL
ncbi:MAG TPA: HEAT repeat domain-containing protein [Plantibacter sp.]|uniref:HEAT repeat domain-containing protein n=1 Tax=unclassified Plantibacter TaxID=2624265 RepID=UPI002B5AF752|nr:HEAT repeat domain-containing protein [Plantibacter sp.]